MESNKGRGSLTSRYLAALLAPAVIAGVLQVTWPFFQPTPVLPYLPAVIFCAWYGGLGPGLLSVVISFLLIDFFLIEPYFVFWFSKQVALGRLLLFAVVGSFISVMSELMHRERRRAEINLESAKHAESSLRDKERFANQIAALSPVVIGVFDLATRRNVYISPNVVNLLGYTPEEIAKMEDPVLVLWHPEDIALVSQNSAQLKHAGDGEIVELEYRMRRRDGEWRWIASRLMPFERDEQGVVRQIVTASFDITERKRAEETLSKAAAIVESSDEAITSKTLDGIITSWNKGAARIYGYSAEEVIGRPVSILIPSDCADYLPEIMKKVRRGEMVDHYEALRIRKDGTRIYVSLSVSPIKDAAGAIIGAAAIGRDITERKRTEAAVQESEEKFRALVDYSIQAIVLFQEGRVTYVNPAYCKITGHSFEESLAQTMAQRFELVHPDDRARIIERQARFERGEPIEDADEVRIRCKDGEMRCVLASTKSLTIQGKPARLGIMVDITERKQAEERLRATTEQLRALSARIQSAKEEEGTRIAREIHDELGGALTCLRWDLESFDKVISESGDQSQIQVQREKIEAMLRLTETTLSTVRRISSELRPTVLDDLGLVEAIEWQAREFQARTGIICRCDSSLENLDLSREQSTAAFRIFQEALTNILRHAQATRINIQMNEENGEFILAIRDNGRGITEDEKSRSQSLGLLGMQERAHLAGGNINITGFDGKGTVVTVGIPISS